MKRVYTADSLLDASIIADCLDGNGLPCEIFHQNAVGALGELPVTAPEVWVRRDLDELRARSLIAELEADRQKRQREGSRRCGTCGETSPAGFDLCWSCGRSI